MSVSKINWKVERPTIITSYKSGASTRQLGAYYNVSHVTICKYLALWKVPRRTGNIRRHIGEQNLKGRVFGNLIVLDRVEETYPSKWRARCKCGRIVALVRWKLLKAKTCGCGPRGPKKRVKP